MYSIRLNENHFANEVCCLGEQLAQILTCIQGETEHLSWYVFDVFGSSHQSIDKLFPKPICIVENTVELIHKVREVVQFHSGVFIGIEKGVVVNWNMDLLPETEEEEGLQHPNAGIEIRTFDCSYFEIFGNDIEIEKRVRDCFISCT